ncbi:MAG: thiamine-phosphate kinase [Candidatus Coatesbacteria bacterium]|nr:thiamine-phosphate kinase [Candidatus Coatesbacteria bacterium]
MRLSERELISLIRRKLATSSPGRGIVVGPGDDAAVVSIPENESLVISTDSLVEDVHFSLKWATGFLLGQKSFLSSISDIYAMGARPHTCLVSLGLSRTTESAFVEDLFDGMLAQAERLGVSIIGGNIARSEKVFIDMTVTGAARRNRIITRGGAKVGDSVFVTGELGGAAIAVEMLLRGQISPEDVEMTERVIRGREVPLEPKSKDAALVSLISRFFAPSLRPDEALLLSNARICTSLIDISDGIGSDLAQICSESQVGALIDTKSIPLFKELPNIAKGEDFELRRLAMRGGEDYELLFTVAPDDELRLQQLFDSNSLCRVSKIGHIIPASEGLVFADREGRPIECLSGFDHFAGKAEGID